MAAEFNLQSSIQSSLDSSSNATHYPAFTLVQSMEMSIEFCKPFNGISSNVKVCDLQHVTRLIRDRQ